MGKIQTPRFAGQETFSLRYGWLKKAVDATVADTPVFTRDDALITLGVGVLSPREFLAKLRE